MPGPIIAWALLRIELAIIFELSITKCCKVLIITAEIAFLFRERPVPVHSNGVIRSLTLLIRSLTETRFYTFHDTDLFSKLKTPKNLKIIYSAFRKNEAINFLMFIKEMTFPSCY